MGGVVVVIDIVQVVRQDEGNVEFLGQAKEILDCSTLNGDSVVHDLDEIVLFAKDVTHRRCRLLGFLVLT